MGTLIIILLLYLREKIKYIRIRLTTFTGLSKTAAILHVIYTRITWGALKTSAAWVSPLRDSVVIGPAQEFLKRLG